MRLACRMGKQNDKIIGSHLDELQVGCAQLEEPAAPAGSVILLWPSVKPSGYSRRPRAYLI